MKLLIILPCILAVLSPVAADSVLEQGIFGDLFQQFVKELDEIPEVILSKAEVAEIKDKLYCITNKINLKENQNKTIEQVTSTYLFIGAGAMCMSDQVTFWKNAADKLYTFAKSQESIRIDHIECLQWQFSKFQPNSRLLRNFDANITQADVNMCKKVNQDQQLKGLVRYFDLMSGGFSELTCGSVNNKIALELAINVLLLVDEKDQKEVDREMKRIADEVKQKVIIMVDCIKDNLDIV
ncbi:hypothetical protein ACKWTF_014810 [Chironomus riparius]